MVILEILSSPDSVTFFGVNAATSAFACAIADSFAAATSASTSSLV
jgi:lauroyl/myristoyl acyltransferase